MWLWGAMDKGFDFCNSQVVGSTSSGGNKLLVDHTFSSQICEGL